ncbi:glutathione S-transferase-like [Humulus lupulus]|uniref:glutathione S-transferase-like n=1 Tax=Humulus lupulus TaxID=3486 RepID=UPI002B405E23|nr:glutathione S-transferase-like [Humulus lupulus]
MAAPVKVFGPPMSTAVSRVLACLIEKDVDFQLISVNMSKGEHKKPEFLKIQPFGQVPAFQDESISLFESRSICRYICEKHADKGNKGLYGTNPLAKASIDQWLEAEAQSFNPPSSVLVFQLAFAPMMKIKQNPSAIKENEDKLAKVLQVYDKRLGESRFLAGDEFSLADLSHLPNTNYLVAAAKDKMEDLFTSNENVGRWWAEISSRDSWKEVVRMQKNTPN